MIMRKWLIPVTLAVALLSGCKKKPPSAPPPQAQAPTISQPEQTAPAQQPTEQTQPETQPTPPQPSTETQPATTTPPPKPRTKPRRSATANNHKPAQSENKPVQQAANNPPPPVAATPAPASNPPPLAPDIPHDQAELQRRTTEQLLETTEYNLRSLHRALTADEQQIVQQIRNFMQQARSAQTDGDVVRAKNLALKAHQLSDALVTP